MPITQDRFLEIIDKSASICNYYIAIGKMLRDCPPIINRASAGANRDQLIALGVLQSLLDLHNSIFDDFRDVAGAIEIERRHFQHAAARNDRNRAKQRRLREANKAQRDGTYIDHFFQNDDEEIEADTEPRETASVEMLAEEFSTRHFRTTELPREPGETLGQWATRLTRHHETITGQVSVPSAQISEAEPTYGDTVPPPPPTLAEKQGNTELAEDLRKPDFTEGENPL